MRPKHLLISILIFALVALPAYSLSTANELARNPALAAELVGKPAGVGVSVGATAAATGFVAGYLAPSVVQDIAESVVSDFCALYPGRCNATVGQYPPGNYVYCRGNTTGWCSYSNQRYSYGPMPPQPTITTEPGTYYGYPGQWVTLYAGTSYRDSFFAFSNGPDPATFFIHPVGLQEPYSPPAGAPTLKPDVTPGELATVTPRDLPERERKFGVPYASYPPGATVPGEVVVANPDGSVSVYPDGYVVPEDGTEPGDGAGDTDPALSDPELTEEDLNETLTETQLEPAEFDKINFLIHASSVFADKFPLDIFGSLPQSGNSQCPSFEFFGYEFELCWINTLLDTLKIPVVVRFAVWAFLTL